MIAQCVCKSMPFKALRNLRQLKVFFFIVAKTLSESLQLTGKCVLQCLAQEEKHFYKHEPSESNWLVTQICKCRGCFQVSI